VWPTNDRAVEPSAPRAGTGWSLDEPTTSSEATALIARSASPASAPCTTSR